MRTSVLLISLTFFGCDGGTATLVDADADTDTDPDPCVLPASATPVVHTDLLTVGPGCFDPSASFPLVLDTSADHGAVYVCDDLWPMNVDWDTERVVVGAMTSCGTSLQDIGMQTSGTIEALLYGLGCGAPSPSLHAIVLPDGPEPVELTICDVDTTPYP